MVDQPWTRAAAHGLCIEDGHLLLARVAGGLADAGRWTLPGGGLDWGESPDAGVVREIFEETGLRAVVMGLAGVWSATFARSEGRPHHSVHIISVLYRCRTEPGALVPEADGTTDLAAWHPLDGLDELPLADITRYGVGLLRS